MENFKKYYSERGPSFDEIDCLDPVAFYEAKGQWARDKVVHAEKLNIYRERLRKCYQREEVNFKDNCQKEIDDYWETFQLYKKDACGYTEGGNVNAYKPSHFKFMEKAIKEMKEKDK